jgi:hypothetical protein
MNKYEQLERQLSVKLCSDAYVQLRDHFPDKLNWKLYDEISAQISKDPSEQLCSEIADE